jgi:uncharacterized protein
MCTRNGRLRLGLSWVTLVAVAGCVGAMLWTSTRSRSASPRDTAALIEAATAGDDAAVERLLSAGVPADALESPSMGYTPLMFAARFGHLDVARRLIDAGANLRAVARGSGTPLACAADGGQPEMIRLLLAHGAEPNVCNPDGHSPLMHAAAHGGAECAELLLAAGADVNARDCSGNTPLLCAAAAGEEAMMQRLTAAGADIHARDCDGRDAATSLAEDKGLTAVGESSGGLSVVDDENAS